MRKVDYHMHTHFSADSTEDARAHIEEALANELEEICFTDHRDFDYPGMAFDLDVKAYQSEIEKLKLEFSDRIKIKWGLEIGLDMNYIDEINSFVTSADFDFVIGSIHVVNHEEFYESQHFFDEYSRKVAYQLYFDAMLACVRKFDCFNSLAHMDYIVRYATYEQAFIGTEEFADEIQDILKTLVAKDKALEVNTRLFDKPKTIEFYQNLLKKFKEYGGSKVTLGTDSHIAKRNWENVEKARKLIVESGFPDLTTYTAQRAD